ncbi:hypothetical protein UFOVP707_32 [uncultured Caudovirales phage]|uniref:Uncharacterized protein n=1 Tax=uncultured Caudovirales phage TaxID=2100421 RepID=A0A6J5NUI1_9CAUD|nr:hypothetical protein UFOVP707_32 [uncultured Caudovirales phage]
MDMLYLILSLAVFYAAFCRITRLDAYAMTRARLAYVLLGIASLASVFSVLFWGYEPGVLDVLNATAILSVLVVSSPGWRGGMPRALRRDDLGIDR